MTEKEIQKNRNINLADKGTGSAVLITHHIGKNSFLLLSNTIDPTSIEKLSHIH